MGSDGEVQRERLRGKVQACVQGSVGGRATGDGLQGDGWESCASGGEQGLA